MGLFEYRIMEMGNAGNKKRPLAGQSRGERPRVARYHPLSAAGNAKVLALPPYLRCAISQRYRALLKTRASTRVAALLLKHRRWGHAFLAARFQAHRDWVPRPRIRERPSQ